MIREFVVTSEDRSEYAEDVVDALLRKALTTEGRTLPSRRRVVPADIRAATKAAMWRAKGSGPAAVKVIALVRYLRNELARGDTVVAFHFDADCPWPSRPAAQSDFDRIRTSVSQGLAPDLSSRLVAIVPHWCIESWTYQHTTEAAAICRKAGDAAAAARFAAIDGDRAALEARDPHADDRYARVGKRHNHRLATDPQFPARRALDALGSYADAVRVLAGALGSSPSSDAR